MTLSTWYLTRELPTYKDGVRRKKSFPSIHRLPRVVLVIFSLITLVYTFGFVNGDQLSAGSPNDWINSVPFKSIPTRTVQELEKWSELQGQLNQSIHPVESGDDRISKKWYASHKNDPRMGFFYASGSSSTSGSANSDKNLSPYQALPVTGPGNYSDDYFLQMGKRKKRRKKVKRDKAKPSSTLTVPRTLSTSSNNVKETSQLHEENGIEATNALQFQSENGRTFFITPLLAYLFPVFLAQMFGMGMIPAAALITLPIFLLPLGIAAAVFLI